MSLANDVKSALPGWHVTESPPFVNADKGAVNVEFHTVGKYTVARVYSGLHAVGSGVGGDVEQALAALRMNLNETAANCALAIDALKEVE